MAMPLSHLGELTLSLFGPPRLARDGASVDLPSRKALALLAYLAITGTSHRRATLAALFWPESDPRGARHALRSTLWLLRRALDDAWLVVDRNTVGLDGSQVESVDVVRFRTLLSQCLTHGHAARDTCPDCLPLLGEAVDLYGGDFLAGFTLRDSVEFDTWQSLETESLRQELVGALRRLVQGCTAQGQVEQAIEHAKRWLALDPLDEAAHRALMRLYAGSGQQSAALRQFEACERVLMEELGVSSGEETKELVTAIRQRQVPQLDVGAPAFAQAPAAPRHNLPPQPTPFVGREEELVHIAQRLADPACRLLTIVGPGGIGKSRLAIQAAGEQVAHFAHSVCFVPLAPVGSGNLLVPTIMEALDVPMYGAAPPDVQLLNTLRQRHLLLILDNFEHLVERAPLVREMLDSAPRLKVLVTSRERLNLRQEWTFSLSGLRVPEKGATAEPESYSAVQLFVQCASRARADFSPASTKASTNAASVSRICQLVGGMPLAIELAAPWIRVMPCEDIAREIERNLGFLATSLRDMPQRHRSMQAVFDQSWLLLSPDEQSVLRKLSVFRGGFRREAAEAVVGASLLTLTALVDRSWIRRSPSGRYEMHELVRQYLAEKRAAEEDQGDTVPIRDRHSGYYTVFVQEREPQLRGRGQREALGEIVTDIDNVRTAWGWSVEQGDVKAISRCVESMWHVAESRGWFREVAEDFRRAATKLREQLAVSRDGDASSAREETAAVLAEILHREAFARLRLGMNARAKPLCEESLALLQCLGDDVRQEKARAHAKLTLGTALQHLGEVNLGDELLREGLVHAKAAGDVWSTTRGLRLLGAFTFGTGRYLEAEQFLQQAITIWGHAGEGMRRALCLCMLSQVLLARGEIERAEDAAREAFRVRQEFGDQGGTSYALRAMGDITAVRGNHELAQRWCQDALTIATQTGNRRFESVCLRTSGWIAYKQRDFPEARRLFDEALVMAREADDLQSPAALVGLGYATQKLGDLQQATKHFGQALEEAIGMGLRPQALDALVGIASLSTQEGSSGRAAELLSLAVQHLATAHVVRNRTQHLLSKLESDLPSDVLAPAVVRGQTRDLQQAAAEMLAELDARPSVDRQDK